jgi:large repetitive protein
MRMNRLVSMRAGAVLASLAMAFAGCTCGKVDCATTPSDPSCVCDTSDLTVAFVAPVEGAMVDQTSTVQVSLSRKGSPVNIGVARLEVRGPGATEFADQGNGTAAGATATFAGVTLQAGENALRATVAEANCTTNANPKTIVVTAKSTVTPPPVIVSCTFPQDSNGDGTLNATELPAGTAISVRVLTTNGAGATFSAPNSNPAMAPIMNDAATLSVPGPSSDGTFSVTATVTRGTGMPTCSPTIQVVRTPGCAVENTTLESPRGPNDDADSMTAGFQVRASATRLTGMAATAVLRMGNESRSVNLNTMASASADFTVASMGTQSYMVTLEASDVAGNPCLVTNPTRNIPVDFDAPVVTITSPSQVDGGVLITRSPVTVTANVGIGDNGATACAFVGGSQEDCGTIVNGSVTLTVAFGSDGFRTIEVRVTDAGGNVGTARVGVNVVLSTCGIEFYGPDTNPALINASRAPGGNFTFRTSSKPICAGQSARLARAAVLDGGTGPFSAAGAASLTIRALPDGGNDAVAAFPTTVSNGDYVYRAEVENFGDAGVDAVQVDVTVDLDGPAIRSPVVPVGQTRANINAAQDSNTSTPGAQRLLSFDARVPMGGRVDVCTTENTGTPTPECGTGWFRLATNVVSPVGSFTFPEGSYDIKIVVVAGGISNESVAVPLTVDVTRPCILANSLRLPQDTNMDGRLNSTELGSAAPRLDFQLDPACADLNLSTLSATAPVVVREVISNVVSTTPLNLAADVAFDTGTGRVRVDLTQGIAAERDYTFFVELQDQLGNRNAYTATMNPALLNGRVDRTAPSCTLVAPTQTTLNRMLVPGGTLNVTVATSSDVGTNGVTVALSGFMSQSGTPSGAGNQAALAFTSLSGTNTRSLDVTCRDTSGNTSTVPQRMLIIDLDDPACAFTAPTTGAMLADLSVTTSLNVTGGDGRTVTISSTVGGSRGTLTVISGVASGAITYANGTQDISAALTDAAGNSGTCSVINVIINSADCGLSVTNAFANANGLWFNRGNTANLTATTGTATVSAQTSGCTTGRVLTLVRTLPVAGTPITATDTAGAVTFTNVAFADDETWSLSVPNGVRPATVQTFRVDLDAPSFGVGPTQFGHARLNGTLTASAAPTFFVAPTDNRNVETSVAGYFADLAAGTPGAQVNLVLDGVLAFDFGLNGTIDVSFKGASLSTQPVTADNQTVSFTGGSVITLPHNDSGTFLVRVTDGAGNSSDWTSVATVDVIAPAAPTVSQSIADARIAEASLGWSPTFDDGTTAASGAHLGYDLRWSTSSVPGSNNLANSTDFFGSAANPEANIAWSANPIADRRLTLPPLNTYFIAVRARDELGNYSAYAAPSSLANFWTPVTISAPSNATSANFGATVLGTPSLNNDGTSDLVVTAPTRTGGGAVFVYYGTSTFASQSSCMAGCQELTPSDAAAGQFGSDVSSGGNLGDVAAENKADLVIAQVWTAASPNNGGRAVIYFGNSASATLDSSNAIELRGDSTNRIGQTARIIPSIDGDNLAELAIAAPFFNGNRGRIFIYRGRTRAQWVAARTATDPVSMVPYIPVSQTTADYVINGPMTLLVSPAGNAFGQNRNGLVSVGDINADSVPDIAIPMSRPSINRYRIFSGAAIAASTGASPLSGDTFLLELTQATTGDNATNTGFGANAVGGVNVVDASASDLVVSFSGAGSVGQVFVYSDPVAMAMGQPTPTSTIRGPLTFGQQVSIGLLNGTADTRNDLLSATALGANNFAYLIYQQGPARPFAGTAPATLGTTPEFWISRFDAAVLTGTAASSLGATNAFTDLDGNGQPDVVLGDIITSSVRVWR